MFDFLGDLFVKWMDAALGWTLSLPRDLTLVIVSAVSAAVLIFLRPLFTPQEWLRRCDDDKKRQAELMKQAKTRNDKESVKRHRLTKGMIGLRAMKCEGWPLLAALGPLIVVGVWAFARLEYKSPPGDAPIEVTANFPGIANGRLVHMVPGGGVSLEEGAVRKIKDNSATWKIRAAARPEPYTLTFAYDGQTFNRTVLVGQRVYEPATVDLDAQRGITATIHMPEAKPLGIIPALPWMACPAWLVGYIVVVIPMVIGLKRVTGIC